MATDVNDRHPVLYLTSCDQHARSAEGTPMVAGNSFSASIGYPALPWGCGSLAHIRKDAPRWLVLDAEDVQERSGGVLIRAARICCDGSLTDALRYLHAHGAAAMPFLGRRRRGNDHAILTTGPMGTIEARDNASAAAGESARLTLGSGATAAVGSYGTIKAGEFARLVGGDHATIQAARFSLATAGMAAEVSGGEGALVLAGAMSNCQVGAGGRAMVDSGGSLDLGPRAVGVGRAGTRFRGAIGAVFVVIDAIADTVPAVLTARVGEGGVKANLWYLVEGHKFIQAKA